MVNVLVVQTAAAAAAATTVVVEVAIGYPSFLWKKRTHFFSKTDDPKRSSRCFA